MFGPFPQVPPKHRGRVHSLQHHSKALVGNPWNDPVERDVWVYTPAVYERQPSRTLPILMVLPAFASTGEMMLARGLTEISLATRIDRMIHQGDCPPFIAVLPDVMTSLVGSQFVDSVGIGDYATWLVDEVRPLVEQNFRTTGRWGAVGKSSGGFGAIHLAMNHPGAFGAVASHAGDMGFDLAFLGEIPGAVAAIREAGGPQSFVRSFWEASRPSGGAFSAILLLCMAAAWGAPAQGEEKEIFITRLPVNFETGEVNMKAFADWFSFDPVVRADDPAVQAALAHLSLLHIDAGDRDEYHLQLGARRFSNRLKQYDIPHVHEEFPGTHRGNSGRFDVSFPALIDALGCG